MNSEDLIIIASGFYEEVDPYQLTPYLDINENTLSRYLKNLEKRGLLISDDTFHLSREGIDHFEFILSRVNDLELTPEQHSVTSICKIRSILPFIKDSATLIQILISIDEGQKLDVIDLIKTSNALRPDSYESVLMDEIMRADEIEEMSTDDQFKDLTMLGRIPGKIINDNIPTRDVLISADQKRRNGKVKEALQMFIDLLNSRRGLHPGEWISCLIGWITCVRNIDGEEVSLAIVDKYLKRVKNTEHKALLSYLKADLLSDSSDMERANAMYQRSLKMMRALDMNISKTELLNSYGVHLFRTERYSLAEKQWKRCRTLCNKHNLFWLKSIAEINLSDIYSMNGKIRSAHNLLNRAERILEEIGDQEGISGVHFNRALVYIREGKEKRGRSSFERSEEYPLIYDRKREERRKVFNDCLRVNGYQLLQKHI